MNPSLVLIDGSYVMFAAYYALPDLVSQTGKPTGAILGVRNVINKLQKHFPDAHHIVAFDSKAPSFRVKQYEPYKKQRKEMPEALALQIPYIHELVRAMGTSFLIQDGFEADDILGSLAVQAEKRGEESLICSADKDFAQLVSDFIFMFHPHKEQLMDKTDVLKKFGVRPEQMIDYLSLMGDSADNIPGIPKVGPKTAATWLQTYGSIDGIVANQEKIKGVVGSNLRDNIEKLKLYQDLVTIRKDLVLEFKKEKRNEDALLNIYQESGFKEGKGEKRAIGDPLGESEDNTPKESILPKYERILVDSISKLHEMKEYLLLSDCFSFDSETNTLAITPRKVAGFSFAAQVQKEHKSFYLPIFHETLLGGDQLPFSESRPVLEELFSSKKRKIAHNLKFDLHSLHALEIPFSGSFEDTILMSYLLDPLGFKGLDKLSEKLLSHTPIPIVDLIGSGKKQISMNQLEPRAVLDYACEDAEVCLSIYEKLFELLKKDDKLFQCYENLEKPLLLVLFRMESLGISLNKDCLKEQSLALLERISSIENESYDLLGEPFNLQSPKQVQEALFDKLLLSSPKKKTSKTGVRSTSESVLLSLKGVHPLVDLILEHRTFSKLQGTYLEALPKASFHGRIHANFNQVVASTGRLSSSNPNLQNIPIKTPEGRMVRKGFIPSSGMKLLSADYSQVELRLMAHFSQDERLIEAFLNGEDIHSYTAASIFSTKPSLVSKEQRRSAKAINFGLIYGMGAWRLSEELGCSQLEAKSFIEAYFREYPKVLVYMESVKEETRKKGYSETLLGRKLWIPNLNHEKVMLRKAAERLSINAPIQGTAADIIKLAMLKVDEHLLREPSLGRLLLSVHDELVLETKNPIELKEMVSESMSQAFSLSVPLVVQIGIGDNWAEIH